MRNSRHCTFPIREKNGRRRPCDNLVDEGRDHCRAGHPCRAIKQRRGALSGVFSLNPSSFDPNTSSYDVEDVVLRKPWQATKTIRVGTEVQATKAIIRDFGWTGRHIVQKGVRGIVDSVKSGWWGDRFTITWEVGFTTHDVGVNELLVVETRQRRGFFAVA